MWTCRLQSSVQFTSSARDDGKGIRGNFSKNSNSRSTNNAKAYNNNTRTEFSSLPALRSSNYATLHPPTAPPPTGPPAPFSTDWPPRPLFTWKGAWAASLCLTTSSYAASGLCTKSPTLLTPSPCRHPAAHAPHDTPSRGGSCSFGGGGDPKIMFLRTELTRKTLLHSTRHRHPSPRCYNHSTRKIPHLHDTSKMRGASSSAVE